MAGINIQYTNQIKVGATKHVVYGKAGIGKTRLTLTSPVQPFIVNTEKGLLSLRKDRVPYVTVEDRTELANVYNYLISPQANNIGLVTFDSISDLGEVIISEEKKKTKDKRAAFGNLNDIIMDCFRDFRDIPNKHVVFIAKEQWFDGMGGMQMVRPAMPDKFLTMQLPYMFDTIMHMTNFVASDGRTYVGMHTQNDFQTIAKDRSGNLSEWEPPNLAHIITKIEKG